MGNPFTEHPRESGQSYAEHWSFAVRVGLQAMAAGATAWVHAFLPFLFKSTTSRILRDLNQRIEAARRAQPPPDPPARP